MTTYRVRLRFHVQKKLNLETQSHNFLVGTQPVTLSPPEADKDISGSNWLVMNARGFSTENEALLFGRKLKAAVEVSAALSRLGADCGTDAPTASFAEAVKKHVLETTGGIVRDNVHGLDVFPDLDNVVIFGISATGEVRAKSEDFLKGIADFSDTAYLISDSTKSVVLLLNWALLHPDPVAQIVFAVSAVEMLGQSEKWSQTQRNIIGQLAADCRDLDMGTPEEREEVSDAMLRGLHRLSLRQGVSRLLDSLGLGHLKKEWNRLYDARSKLMHGLAPKPGKKYDSLAFEVVNLCGQILMHVIAREVAGADQAGSKFYVVPKATPHEKK